MKKMRLWHPATQYLVHIEAGMPPEIQCKFNSNIPYFRYFR